MKKICLFIGTICLTYLLQGQDTLYYFTTSDSSMVGVKNNKGDIIIPPQKIYSDVLYYLEDSIIHEPTIEFFPHNYPEGVRNAPDSLSPVTPAGVVYDRKGNFLYTPQLFDSGPDYWHEGKRRYAAHNKIGFVNFAGEKITPANLDFASPFNYGYAEVYINGWRKEYESGGEHWYLTASSDSSDSYLINAKGDRVQPLVSQVSNRDYLWKGDYYPYPFSYNKMEQNMVDSLEKIDVLNDINLYHYPKDKLRDSMLLQFEIVERPDEYNPFYVLQGFMYPEKHKRIEDDAFLVSKDGKNYFHRQYEGSEPVPLQQWIEETLADRKNSKQKQP